MWESFKNQLLTIQDKYVPVKMKDKDGKIWEPWMTRETVSLVKKKEAYINFRKLKTDKVLKEYKDSRKELKQVLMRAKRGHEMSLAGRIQKNPVAFYAHIRRKRVAKERMGPLKNSGGNVCVEPDEVGEVLNECSTSVITKEKDVVDGECRKEDVDILGHVEKGRWYRKF